MRVSSNKLLQKYAQPTSHNAVTLLSAQNLSDSNFPEAAGCLVTSSTMTYRHFSKTYCRKVLGGGRLLEEAEFLKHAAPDIDALVTRDTAVCFEDGVPPAFDGAQGLGLVPEVAIEAGVWRHQGALVGRQGVQHVGWCQAPRVQGGKGHLVVGNRPECG